MKQKALRITTLIIVILMTLSITSYAAVESSLYLSYYNAYITKTGNTVTVHFDVEGTRKMDTIGAPSIYLYERPDSNSSWTLVETYLSTDPTYTATLIANNTVVKIDSVSYDGNSSYQYKAYVTVYAEKDGGSDSRNLIIYS